MIHLLLLALVAQVPLVPGETTLVSFCKQGRLSACEALRQINPKLAAEIAAESAKSALRLEVLKASEGTQEQEAEASEAGGESSSEPPHCKGQNHHVISRPIARRLEDHETLRGLYAPRDARFVAKAKDTASHCGYQEWHRHLDKEIIQWLDRNPNATPSSSRNC
jgi:hypothetical protein